MEFLVVQPDHFRWELLVISRVVTPVAPGQVQMSTQPFVGWNQPLER